MCSDTEAVVVRKGGNILFFSVKERSQLTAPQHRITEYFKSLS